MQHGSKTDVLIKKESRLIVAGLFRYQTQKTARKSVKGLPRSLSAFSANINTEVLDSQCCHRAMLIILFKMFIHVVESIRDNYNL